VRFRPDLAWAQPTWLDPDSPRGRNVPQEMTWNLGVTWAMLLVDTMFATNVTPGEFESFGHDYRSDLGAVATAAFGFSGSISSEQASALEILLRKIEMTRAQMLAKSPF
ncbi:MAG: alpha/beta-hydrolase family protein, partial [Candidatus Nanopelagicales bacterium]|nr:alpha/beta-hydrolase family protein [Candidatus Nanopelagicales bacterium]